MDNVFLINSVKFLFSFTIRICEICGVYDIAHKGERNYGN